MKDDNRQKIHAMMIFEIIGRPKEYLVNSLNGIVDQLSAEEGIEIKNRNVKEPKKMEESAGIANAGEEFGIEEKEFYLTFADVELEANNLFTLTRMIFRYMPAHVEIISPEVVSTSNGEWSDLLSELLQRLHGYDEVARVMQVENASLESQLKKLSEPKENPKKETKTKNSKKPKKSKRTKGSKS